MPLSERDSCRPVKSRTCTFRPNYVSLAGTYQCNLTCAHCCVPIEWTDRLDIPTALRFLEDAHAHGIELLGFTGGEPFLYPEFLIALTRRAAQLGFRFDKIVANGVWFTDEPRLRSVLGALKDAGFTGKIGLGVDKFHGIRTADLVTFCKTARAVFERDTILSLAYASRRRRWRAGRPMDRGTAKFPGRTPATRPAAVKSAAHSSISRRTFPGRRQMSQRCFRCRPRARPDQKEQCLPGPALGGMITQESSSLGDGQRHLGRA